MTLVAYYKFNNNANDSSGNGYNCTSSSLLYDVGIVGYGGRSNSYSTYTNLPTALGPVFDSTNDFSISIWVKKEEGWTTNYNDFIGIRAAHPTVHNVRIDTSNNNYVRCRVDTDSDTNKSMIAGNISDNKWHYVVFNYTSSTKVFRFYFDNVYSNQMTVTGAFNFDSGITAFGFFRIGTGMHATIDEARIYNHILSTQEMTNLYSTGRIHLNINDSFAGSTGLQINIGDTWKQVSHVKINVGDAWKTVF